LLKVLIYLTLVTKSIPQLIFVFKGTRISTKLAYDKGHRFTFTLKFPTGFTDGVVAAFYVRIIRSINGWINGRRNDVKIKFIDMFIVNIGHFQLG
jgi:hypothetical protein